VADEVRRLNPGAPAEVLLARAYGVEGNVTAGWADSVTGGAYGAWRGVPVILTQTEGVHPAVGAWLGATRPNRVVLLGGGAALSDVVARDVRGAVRVFGPERTATAAEVARRLWGASASGPRQFAVINGFHPEGWAHGLAVAGTAAAAQAPLLLVTPDVPAATAGMVGACRTTQVDLLLVGGGDVIPSATEQALTRLDGGAC
jgi:hypothetical protein